MFRSVGWVGWFVFSALCDLSRLIQEYCYVASRDCREVSCRPHECTQVHAQTHQRCSRMEQATSRGRKSHKQGKVQEKLNSQWECRGILASLVRPLKGF